MNTITIINGRIKNTISGLNTLLVFVAIMLCMTSTLSHANTIESIQYTTLQGNRLQIAVAMTESAVKPLSFTIDNPARIAFDFADTTSTLPKRPQAVGIGIAQSVTTITAKNRTRVILNLTEVVPYQVTTEGNNVLITLDSESSSGTSFAEEATASTLADSGSQDGSSRFENDRFEAKKRGLDNIDFRRGEDGEGRIIVSMTESNIPMDIHEEFGKVIVEFIGAELPEELRQTLDVIDFATPVKSISSFSQEGNVRLEILPINDNFEHVAYQANNIFTLELKPISKEELEEVNKEKFGYTGERLSLNFQDIPVRAVLQLIADFTELNVVVSDSVGGSLTLRLKNVPWDQALDIILKAKGLSKRESGNVMLVAPSEEIAAQEKIDLEAQMAVTDLSPLKSVYFEVNYAKVTDLITLFKSGGEEGGSLLSNRGSIIVDERTNTLIIKDTQDTINEVRKILTKLDIPIRQVMISSRIVIANDQFSKELGARFGVSSVQNINGGAGANGGATIGISGNAFETDAIQSAAAANGSANASDLIFGTVDRFNVNLPAVGAAGSLAFSVLKGGSLVDLEISALQADNKGELISSPRVVTADRHEAFIEQGVEVPYQTASSSGATTISFKKAVLSIKVTPQITPDDRIIMDLEVKKDAVGQVFVNIPSIDTREVSTQVLVDNGDTIVLGGIYEQITRDDVEKVPVLGDLPIIGYFFRHSIVSDTKAELLIFVTPKVLKDSLSL